jgi:hypothetical protein
MKVLAQHSPGFTGLWFPFVGMPFQEAEFLRCSVDARGRQDFTTDMPIKHAT